MYTIAALFPPEKGSFQDSIWQLGLVISRHFPIGESYLKHQIGIPQAMQSVLLLM